MQLVRIRKNSSPNRPKNNPGSAYGFGSVDPVGLGSTLIVYLNQSGTWFKQTLTQPCTYFAYSNMYKIIN